MRTRTISKLFALLGLGSVLFACSTDIDINAPYKETPVIYGFLDPDSSYHVIRVSKAFFSQGDANNDIKIADSSIYDVSKVELVLQHLTKDGSVLTESAMKDSLVKNSPASLSGSIMYYTYKGKIDQDGTRYKVIFRNKETKLEASVEMPVIGNFLVREPRLGDKPSLVTFVAQNAYRRYAPSWDSASRAFIYEVSVKFHYTEIDKLDTNKKEEKFILIKSNQFFAVAKGTMPIDGLRDFYPLVGSSILPGLDKKRKIGKIETSFTLASEIQYKYQLVQGSHGGILDVSPIYGNVTNGLGLVATRIKRVYFNELNADSKDSLIQGVYTSGRNFYK